MNDFHLSDDTLDDLLRSAIEAVIGDGEPNSATRGHTREITGVLLELCNPRARLSRTESRGKAFSCLGELCWYLAGSDDVEFIGYYIDRYRDDAENGVIYGAYGPRLRAIQGVDQLATIVQLLRVKPTTRRAVIQLFAARDLVGSHREIPCTCTLQFLLRDGRLHLLANMRSNDVILGLPHDVFCFTMIQEAVARELGVELGWYKHMVGSLHLYENMIVDAEQFMGEGFQSTQSPMPAMPQGSQCVAVKNLLEAEVVIRTTGVLPESTLDGIDPYWADLIRLLAVHRYAKDRALDRIEALAVRMSSDVYRPYINKRLARLM